LLIDSGDIFTAYIYASAISIGLEKINHPSYRFWSQKSYDIIILFMSSGGIERLDHENKKLIVIDHLIKEVYCHIKRNDFYRAKYLALQAKFIAALTDTSKIGFVPDPNAVLPAFITVHLFTLNVWTQRNIKEKISTLKSFLSDIHRVQLGSLIMIGFLLVCESEEIYSSLMGAILVPIVPVYSDAVLEYFNNIWKYHSIIEATPQMRSIFHLSMALLRIRCGEVPESCQYLNSAFTDLCNIQPADTNTFWFCVIGLSLSVICVDFPLIFQFQDYQRKLSFSMEWYQQFQLPDKILALSLNNIL